MISLVRNLKNCLFVQVFISFIYFVTPAVHAYAETTSYDDKSAIILSYQRIGEDHLPDTNIRIEQFEDHIQELVNGQYNVMALPELIDALSTKTSLPPRSIAITFDGGYSSVFKYAVPLLNKYNLPFTVFFAPDTLDTAPFYLSRSNIKKLRKNKLTTIGIHPSSYARLADKDSAEIKRQINNAKVKFRKLTGHEVTVFSYPFGEYSLLYRNIIEQSGFKAALSQHSGAVSSASDLYALPRFTMTESYADIERFRLITNALPLPVTDIEPKDVRLNTAKPVIGFTVDEKLSRKLTQLSCFISGQEKPLIEIIGKNRIEIRPAMPFTVPRIRINCTLPGPQSEPGESPKWRWFGLLMTLPEDVTGKISIIPTGND